MKCFSFEHKCKQCGMEFRGTKNRIYCSHRCAYNDKERLRDNNRKDRGNGTCKRCGKVFPITTKSPRGIFCSRNCCGKYTSEKILLKRPRIEVPKAKLNCEYCHKEFGVIPSMANKRRFCSTSCATLGSTKKRTMTIRNRFSHYGGYSRCKHGWHQIGDQEIFARSLWESNYAYYLEWLRANGAIQSWQHEPETFWFEGIKRGVCSYLPDFKVVENNGDVVYHEVKGWMDKKSITKLKRMKKYHPTVKMFLADSKWFAQNAKKLSGLVTGWGTEPVKKVKAMSQSKLTKKKLAGKRRR
jgi:hypothetical protein